MIGPNDPEIDVDELMLRVKREAARIRVARHATVLALLAEAERKNGARREWPPRLRLLTRTGPIGRGLLRLWNYQIKEQREKDALIIAAVRRMADDALGDAEP
jgi:hypothetical protein